MLRSAIGIILLAVAGCAAQGRGATYAMGGTNCCMMTLTTEGYAEDLPCLKQNHDAVPKLIHEDSRVPGDPCPCEKGCLCHEREKSLRKAGYPVDLRTLLSSERVDPGDSKE